MGAQKPQARTFLNLEPCCLAFPLLSIHISSIRLDCSAALSCKTKASTRASRPGEALRPSSPVSTVECVSGRFRSWRDRSQSSEPFLRKTRDFCPSSGISRLGSEPGAISSLSLLPLANMRLDPVGNVGVDLLARADAEHCVDVTIVFAEPAGLAADEELLVG